MRATWRTWKVKKMPVVKLTAKKTPRNGNMYYPTFLVQEINCYRGRKVETIPTRFPNQGTICTAGIREYFKIPNASKNLLFCASRYRVEGDGVYKMRLQLRHDITPILQVFTDWNSSGRWWQNTFATRAFRQNVHTALKMLGVPVNGNSQMYFYAWVEF